MAITFIRRDWADSVAILRIVTTDNLATVGATGYLTAQAANILAVNHGTFEFSSTDYALVYASNGWNLFNISADFTSLIPPPNISQYVSVPITSAQFEAMYATPIQLVTAPGANLLLVVEKFYLALVYGTTQYTAGGAIAIQYEGTVHGGGVAASGTLAAATVNGAVASTVYELSGPSSIVFAATVNEPLYLSNATQAFATGDSTFLANLYYRVISV